MKIKRIILTILLISWMGVIFIFSSQDGEQSKKLSDGVTEVIVNKVIVVTKIKVSPEKKIQIVEKSHLGIRKCAHFTLYFILGILSFLTCKSYGIKKIYIPLLICLLYAMSDEIHQMFTLDRYANLLDVFIDFSGALVSIFILNYLIDVNENKSILNACNLRKK